MPSLLQRLTRPSPTRAAAVALSVDESRGVPAQTINNNYDAFARFGYAGNGVVFACIAERRRVFSDVEFRWQRLADKALFGSQTLSLVENPWPGGTTQDLLDRMMVHNDLGGNSYVHRSTLPRTGQPILQPLRPDWVQLVVDPAGAEVLAYIYWEGGKHSGADPQVLPADDVAHFYTNDDPTHPWRGMSWLTPVLREIETDGQHTKYQQKFYENAATPALLIRTEKVIESEEARRQLRDQLERRHSGWQNAFRTLILDDGADATPLGFNFEQSQFVEARAENESRIVMASSVPGILVGSSKGHDASTYSNFGQASRSFATKMKPMWRNVCGSLERVVDFPPNTRGGVRLWYDDSDNAAQREDAKDEAENLGLKSRAIRQLLDAGFTADSAVAAIEGNDLSLLDHSGLFSVQLQPAGANPVEQSETEGPDDDD